MKFTPEHLAILEQRIDAALTHVQKRRKAVEYMAKGFSYRRFIWDCYWLSNTRVGDGRCLSSNCGIDGDYTDAHIETALKAILKKTVSPW